MCHAVEPVWPSIPTAPRGVLPDDADHIRRNARLIGRNAARSNAISPGNITEMTPDELPPSPDGSMRGRRGNKLFDPHRCGRCRFGPHGPEQAPIPIERTPRKVSILVSSRLISPDG
jgi:hypothetical protein